MNPITKLLAFALLTLTLSACGTTSGDEAGNSENLNFSDRTDANPRVLDGIYLAQGYDDEQGNFEFVAFADNGQLKAFTGDGILYSGTLEPKTDGTFGTTARLYNQELEVADGMAAAGTYAAQSYFEGTYETVSESTGTFRATYDAQAYHQPASLALASGIWTIANTSIANSISINTNGDLYGTDADGCVYSGEVYTPKSTRNMYRINLIIENCSTLNGNYSGLAIQGANDQGDTLMMMISNNAYGFYFQLQRQ